MRRDRSGQTQKSLGMKLSSGVLEHRDRLLLRIRGSGIYLKKGYRRRRRDWIARSLSTNTCDFGEDSNSSLDCFNLLLASFGTCLPLAFLLCAGILGFPEGLGVCIHLIVFVLDITVGFGERLLHFSMGVVLRVVRLFGCLYLVL